jgi:hypothetical protein
LPAPFSASRSAMDSFCRWTRLRAIAIRTICTPRRWRASAPSTPRERIDASTSHRSTGSQASGPPNQRAKPGASRSHAGPQGWHLARRTQSRSTSNVGASSRQNKRSRNSSVLLSGRVLVRASSLCQRVGDYQRGHRSRSRQDYSPAVGRLQPRRSQQLGVRAYPAPQVTSAYVVNGRGGIRAVRSSPHALPDAQASSCPSVRGRRVCRRERDVSRRCTGIAGDHLRLA